MQRSTQPSGMLRGHLECHDPFVPVQDRDVDEPGRVPAQDRLSVPPAASCRSTRASPLVPPTHPPWPSGPDHMIHQVAAPLSPRRAGYPGVPASTHGPSRGDATVGLDWRSRMTEISFSNVVIVAAVAFAA